MFWDVPTELMDWHGSGEVGPGLRPPSEPLGSCVRGGVYGGPQKSRPNILTSCCGNMTFARGNSYIMNTIR